MTREVLNALGARTNGEPQAEDPRPREENMGHSVPCAAEETEERIAAPAPPPARDDTAETSENKLPVSPAADRPICAREPDDNSERDPIRAHYDRLCAQGEALRAEFPDFDLAAALHDPDFLRLTAPGLGIDPRRAWLALHPEILERRAARSSAAALARSLASAAARPREGGGQGGGALGTDYRRLSRAEQQRLKRRIYDAAALGEKIYP